MAWIDCMSSITYSASAHAPMPLFFLFHFNLTSQHQRVIAEHCRTQPVNLVKLQTCDKYYYKREYNRERVRKEKKKIQYKLYYNSTVTIFIYL